ncbi:hypothetical protein [Candidatus Enterococcus clewellii]|uniref:Uncharacterized protein n=1 Tax=Candidatus Enterococcus clewellii TaxID=1834193 RepID=A0A242KC63_9ENTE|nr:hypothetical protein [Enterococcus sp. 9E7_DIV0242]OTP18742.1 hypothetical protein A5888_000556 [Enterococcus sp. 9E7_DIV0242]
MQQNNEKKLTAVQKMAMGLADQNEQLPEYKRMDAKEVDHVKEGNERQEGWNAFHQRQRKKFSQSKELTAMPYADGVEALKSGKYNLVDTQDLKTFLSHAESFNSREGVKFAKYKHQTDHAYDNWKDCLNNIKEIKEVQDWLTNNPYATVDQAIEQFPDTEGIPEATEENE